MAIDRALTDPNLLGAGLGGPASWATWISVLRATFGLPLTAEDRDVFGRVAGDRAPPGQRVNELWAVVGRRSGKSRMAAALAVFLALFQKHRLAAGEAGVVLVVAQNLDQAGVVFKYIEGFLRVSPVLAREIASVTASEIRLRNDVVISVQAANFRSIRGRTVVAAVFDETSYWRDIDSANPDLEVFRAVKPALVAAGGMLISISTPYRKLGLMHQKYRDHFGVDGDVLVVQGDSRVFNPTLDDAAVEAALVSDPEGNRAEWLGEFRTDISAFLSDDLIDAAVEHGRPLELPPRGGVRYVAFVDPSGGRGDSFTLCIGHREGNPYVADAARFVADVVRARHPPFSPPEVVAEFSLLLKDYKLNTVTGDNYSAAWCETAFRNLGIRYVRSEKPKSAIYLESLPLWTRGAISIPDMPRLLRELRLLERRTHRSGKDSVDHGKSGHDDLANALCGCAVNCIQPKSSYSMEALVRDPAPEPQHEPRRGSTYRVDGVDYARLGVRPLPEHPFFSGRR
jgi:Terminase large subunit, ATPase domain